MFVSIRKENWWSGSKLVNSLVERCMAKFLKEQSLNDIQLDFRQIGKHIIEIGGRVQSPYLQGFLSQSAVVPSFYSEKPESF